MVIVFFREDKTAVAPPTFTLSARQLWGAAIILLLSAAAAVLVLATLIAAHWVRVQSPIADDWVRQQAQKIAATEREQERAARAALHRQVAEVRAQIEGLRASGKLIAARLQLPAAILIDNDDACQTFPAVADSFSTAPLQKKLNNDAARLSRLEKHYSFLSQQSVLESVLLDTIPMAKPLRPFAGERIWRSSVYGRRADPFTGRSRFHGGDDFPAKRGTPVLAAATGVVSFRGKLGNYGNAVQLSHGRGVSTLYGHLQKINVAARQYVQRGDIIGTVGNSGRSSGPHLHYEVRVDNRARPVRTTIKKITRERTPKQS